MALAPDTRSLGELFADLSREIATLVRNEIALARVELADKAARVGRHLGVIAAGGVIAIGGVLTLIAALVLVLVRAGLPPWGAALLVGLGVVAAGALLVTRAMSALRHENLVPTETIRTLKETTAWKGHAAR
jgi:hypothetical protein